MSTPRVSVIIPVFNCADVLPATLASIGAQTLGDLEVLIVDDGSTDATLDAARAMAALDARFRVFARPHAGKPSIARNHGLEQARGEYVAFLDGDDVAAPTKLARQAAVLDARPEVGMVFHDFRHFTATDADAGPPVLAEMDYLARAGEWYEPLGEGVFLGAPSLHLRMVVESGMLAVNTITAMVRRQVLLEHGLRFREDLTVAEDIDLWWRIARVARVAYVDEALAYYRMRPGSMTRRPHQPALVRDAFVVKSAMLESAERECDEAMLRRFVGSRGRYWYDIGYDCAAAGLVEEARHAYMRALALRPALSPAAGLLKTYLPGPVRGWLRARRGAAHVPAPTGRS